MGDFKNSRIGKSGWKILILAVICAGVVVYYLSSLTTNPPGFYIDEAANSYNAYQIAQTGKNEFGETLPLFFPVFPLGPPFNYLNYVDPVQVYVLAAIFEVVHPTSSFLPRALSAVGILLTCLLLGLLARRMTGRDVVGIAVGFTAFFTPWFFELGRLGFAVGLYPLTVTLILYSTYRACQKPKWSLADCIFIAVSLGLATYTYAIGRLLGPAFAIGLLLTITGRARIRSVLTTWVCYGLTLVPIAIFHFHHPDALMGRYNMTVGYSSGKSYGQFFAEFASHLLSNIDPWKWFVTGDLNLRHHVSGVGALLLIPVLMAFAGLFVLGSRLWRDPWWRFTIFGLVVSFVPASLTKDTFHALRLSAMPVFLLVLLIPTLKWLTDGWGNVNGSSKRLLGERPFRSAAFVTLMLLTVGEIGHFQYLFNKYGPERGGHFDSNFPPVFAKALEQPQRPIYLVDQAYYHAFWQAIIQGVDPANFVKLPPYHRPPANSIILSGEEGCSECDVLYKDIPYILYKTYTGPVTSPQARSHKGDEAGQYSKPRGLAEDKDGNYYIADTDNGRIEKFDPAGNFISMFGVPGTGTGEIKEPNGVAVSDAGEVYVTDAANHKLAKFDKTGTFVKEWKGPDTGFYGPRDLAFGPNGRLYIVDQGRARIVSMDTAAESFSTWGTMGADEGQFDDPYGIDVADGKVFVTDLGNKRVEVFDLTGKFIRSWPVPQWEHTSLSRPDVKYDAENRRAYVTDSKVKEVLVFDAEGNSLEPLKPEPPDELNNPCALVLSTVGGLKHLLVLNSGGDLQGVGEPGVSTILLPTSAGAKPQARKK